MSISSALNSAMSGLVAAGRASEVVSENIANAMTEGYGRRTLRLSSQTIAGPGVRVLGVDRHANPALIAGRRQADAGQGAAQAVTDFFQTLEGLYGLPDAEGSLSARLSRFQTSLVEAASRPESGTRLDTVARRAADLATTFNTISQGIQDMRSRADREIAQQVNSVNQALSDLQTVNRQIMAQQASGQNTASLLDQRHLLVDRINTIIPVNVVERPRGGVALYTDGGAVLIDGPAGELGFSQTHTITPYQTLEDGHLSGLSLGGRTLSAEDVSGGTLGALFQVRDKLAVTAQAELDAAARDLVKRFQDPTVDPTLSVGDAGLFTDGGGAFDAADQVGISARLQLNALADPQAGGDSWRLRDGLGAATPGTVGNASLLQALGAALESPRPVTGAGFGTGARSALQIGSDLTSRASASRTSAEDHLSFVTANRTAMLSAEKAEGVDTDAELQTLMIVEQAYAANARMIQTADELMKILLEL